MKINDEIDEKIKSAIDGNAHVLGIKKPRFVYGETESDIASYAADDAILTIDMKKVETEEELYFAIAHEMRHIWQLKENIRFYYKGYKTLQECQDEDIFHMQVAELDADAWAMIIMEQMYQTMPSLDSYSEKTRLAIHSWAENEILPTLEDIG